MVFGARVGGLACLGIGDKLKTEMGQPYQVAKPNAASMDRIGVRRGGGVKTWACSAAYPRSSLLSSENTTIQRVRAENQGI